MKLEGLAAVPWHTLTHAYGPAIDVPALLEGVGLGDPEALDALFGNIWHQGTVYAATVPAVPFLLELLSGPQTDVVGVLALLEGIARGSSYLDVHQHLDLPSERPSRAEVEVELAWVRAARAAVHAGVPVFVRLLSHGDEAVRAMAAHVLGSCPVSEDATRALSELTTSDESSIVRVSAMFTLAALNTASPQLRERWASDASPAGRVTAAVLAVDFTARERKALLEDVPSALTVLEKLPRSDWHGNPMGFVFDRLGEQWDLKHELLEAWLESADAEVRLAALHAVEALLRDYRPAAARLCGALTRRLEDSAVKVRRTAARLLALIGRAAAPAADALWRVLEAGAPARATAESAALEALCGLRDARVAAYLAARLEGVVAGTDELTNLTAVLETLGPWAPSCLRPLIDLIPLADEGNPRIAVIEAVGRYGAAAAPAVPATSAQLESHPHISTRVLGDLGLVALSAARDLERMVNHEETWVATNAARALFRIRGDAGPALSMIRAALSPATDDARTALGLLRELGAAGAPLADAAKGLLTSEDDWLSEGAALAWWSITRESAPALPVLLRRLEPGAFSVLECLAEMGPLAHAAAPKLRASIEDVHRQFRGGTMDSLLIQDDRWVDACRATLARIEAR